MFDGIAPRRKRLLALLPVIGHHHRLFTASVLQNAA
jgi:hypothetical protein